MYKKYIGNEIKDNSLKGYAYFRIKYISSEILKSLKFLCSLYNEKHIFRQKKNFYKNY